MLARWARILGDRLAATLELPQEAAERAAYALELVFLNVLTLGAIVLASLLTGLFWPAIAAAATSALMRSVSGGAHSQSPWRCIILSTILALVFGLTGRVLAPYLQTPTLAVLVGAVALPGTAVLLRYAPADTPAKPIPSGQRMGLKVSALVLLIMWTLGMLLLPLGGDLCVASWMAMAWQVSSLTPTGFGFSNRLDQLLSGGR